MRRLSLVVLVLALSIGAMARPAAARLGEWINGNQLYYLVDRACRDGLALRLAVFSNSIDPGVDTNVTIALAVRVHNGTPLTPFTLPVDDTYGPLLVGQQNYPIPYRPDAPVDADLDGNGTIDTTFYNYGTAVIAHPLQAVGTDLIVYEPNVVNTIVTVENCYLNPPPERIEPPAFVTVAQRPDLLAAAPGSVVKYTLEAHNWGDGPAGEVAISFPFDPAVLQVLDASFDSDSAWVSELGDASLVIKTGRLDSGASVRATLRFLVRRSAATGVDFSARAWFGWWDSAGQRDARSNRPDIRTAASSSSGWYPLSVAADGAARVFGSGVFIPNEPVALWYNTPAGDAVSVGRVWADENGAISASLNTAELARGNYSMVAYGVWSKLTAVGAFSR
ncbi:MAG TPA: hypothetical protein VD886_02110 [Herpetosiphonaceae bacterium]|nr:hypothetical protein [Herpetosiphonaceae bacterium]